jgi:heme/copper-type cytochrome/quinol oxidase subunit 4
MTEEQLRGQNSKKKYFLWVNVSEMNVCEGKQHLLPFSLSILLTLVCVWNIKA